MPVSFVVNPPSRPLWRKSRGFYRRVLRYLPCPGNPLFRGFLIG